MTSRAVAYVVILVLVLAALAASEHQATNYGLPLVNTAQPQQMPAMRLYTVWVERRNVPVIDERPT